MITRGNNYAALYKRWLLMLQIKLFKCILKVTLYNTSLEHCFYMWSCCICPFKAIAKFAASRVQGWRNLGAARADKCCCPLPAGKTNTSDSPWSPQQGAKCHPNGCLLLVREPEWQQRHEVKAIKAGAENWRSLFKTLVSFSMWTLFFGRSW